MCNCCPNKKKNPKKQPSLPLVSLIYDSLPEQPALYPGPAFLYATRSGMFLLHLGAYIQSGPASLQRQGGGAVLNTTKMVQSCRKENRIDVFVPIFASMFDGNVRACQCGFQNKSASVCMCAHVGLSEFCGHVVCSRG